MLLYHTNSWHYLLVLYVFGKNFFLESDGFDLKAMDSQYNPQTKTEDFKIVYKKKPRTVNFCPYCRAVLYSVISLPFVWLWKKLPHRPKKERTHQEIMKSMKRRSFIIRSFAGGINIALGLLRLIEGDMVLAAFQISIGVLLIVIFQFPKVFAAPFGILIKFFAKYWPKKKQKLKQQKPVKSPSLIKTYFTEKHDVFCPPIAFVDSNDTKTRV